MGRSKSAALEAVQSLNRAEPLFISAMSSVPFIFDGEILITNSSVSKVWKGISDAGFTVTDPVVTSLSHVAPEDYVLFRNSWELETFFKNKIPRYAYKITIEGLHGEVLMIVYRDKSRSYSLMGLKAEAK